MGEKSDIAEVTGRGSFNLFWGMVSSSILSAISTIIIGKLLSPSEFGVIAVAMITPNLLLTFKDWGVNGAMVKYMAQYRSENKKAKVKTILVSGYIFEIIMGFSLSIIILLLSDYLANDVFQRPEISSLIRISSFIILGNSLLTASQSVFTGFERMAYHSLTRILYSVFRAIISISLVMAGFGVFGATFGSSTAPLIAGLIGGIIVYSVVYKQLKEYSIQLHEIVKTMKEMLKYGIPFSVSIIVGGFLMQFYNILLATNTTDALIGNYKVASNFSVLITFFSTPITIMLFLTFAKLNAEQRSSSIGNIFKFSVKYGSLFVVPAAVLVMTLAEPAVFTLYKEEYSKAPYYLILYTITFLYSTVGSLGMETLLNGQGKTDMTMKLGLISAAVGVPLSLVLIPSLGPEGLILTMLLTRIPTLSIGLLWSRRLFKITIDWVSSVKILLSALLASIITYILVSLIGFPYWAQLVIGTAVFLTIYLVTVALIGTLDEKDMHNLRQITKGLGPFAHLFNLILRMISKLSPSKENIEEPHQTH